MNDGMLKPALVGGVALGILSVIPVLNLVNCFCCAWVIGGGILAASLYVKGAAEAVTLGRGLALGLLTGAIGGVVDTLFTIPLQMILSGLGADAMSQIEQVLERIPDLPPESKEALRSIFSNPRGAGLVLMILGALITLVVFSLMGMIGGAIGVAIFEKRKPGQPSPGSAGSPPVEPYPPPPLPPAE